MLLNAKVMIKVGMEHSFEGGRAYSHGEQGWYGVWLQLIVGAEGAGFKVGAADAGVVCEVPRCRLPGARCHVQGVRFPGAGLGCKWV